MTAGLGKAVRYLHRHMDGEVHNRDAST